MEENSYVASQENFIEAQIIQEEAESIKSIINKSIEQLEKDHKPKTDDLQPSEEIKDDEIEKNKKRKSINKKREPSAKKEKLLLSSTSIQTATNANTCFKIIQDLNVSEKLNVDDHYKVISNEKFFKRILIFNNIDEYDEIMIPVFIPKKLNISGAKNQSTLKKENNIYKQVIICLSHLDLTHKVSFF